MNPAKVKRISLLMIVLVVLPAQGATPVPAVDEAVVEAMAQMLKSLFPAGVYRSSQLPQKNSSHDNWQVITDSPEEGFSAITLSPISQAGLSIGCSEELGYNILALWLGTNPLGTYYEDADYQPVTLNWRSPNSTQQQRWRHISVDEGDAVAVSSLSGEESAAKDFLTRLPQHSELEVVVELSPGGPTNTAVFENLAGAPLDRVRQACGDAEVASAQHKYIFPQFAFGGGWESTLMVQARDVPTVCTFSAQDRFLTMRGLLGNNISGTSILLTFGMNEWTILKTSTPQGMAASSGMAVLDCDEEVSANTLFSLEVGGSLVAEALVESSEEIVSGEPTAQFLADHRDGARFAVAVANPSDQPLDVLIAVGDLGGQQIGEVTVNVPANAAKAFFVDELVTIPTGHTGQVFIWPSNNPGPSAYVVGIRVTGLVITTIPATIVDTTPQTTSLAPENEQAFHNRVVGRRAATDDPTYYVEFVSPGRFRETDGANILSGSYTYQNTGPNTGTLTFNYDIGIRCPIDLVFTSTTTVTATNICSGQLVTINFRLM